MDAITQAALDWTGIAAELDVRGCATTGVVLSPAECRALAGLYAEEQRFRSRVVMVRHGFGRGEYQYFARPLPDVVQLLRERLYVPLAPLANRWNAAMGIDVQFPPTHAAFLARCHAAGRRGRHRCCYSMGLMILTVCIRTFTGSMCFRCRLRFCCRSLGGISAVGSSC